MADDCPRKGKLIGGCKFEARCDLGPADLSQFCTRRGRTIERGEKSNG